MCIMCVGVTIFYFMNPGYVFSAHLYSQLFSYHNLHNCYTNHYSTQHLNVKQQLYPQNTQELWAEWQDDL